MPGSTVRHLGSSALLSTLSLLLVTSSLWLFIVKNIFDSGWTMVASIRQELFSKEELFVRKIEVHKMKLQELLQKDDELDNSIELERREKSCYVLPFLSGSGVPTELAAAVSETMRESDDTGSSECYHQAIGVEFLHAKWGGESPDFPSQSKIQARMLTQNCYDGCWVSPVTCKRRLSPKSRRLYVLPKLKPHLEFYVTFSKVSKQGEATNI